MMSLLQPSGINNSPGSGPPLLAPLIGTAVIVGGGRSIGGVPLSHGIQGAADGAAPQSTLTALLSTTPRHSSDS